MTLSALASTLDGIVRPICLAAFRLTMNSNFVGCSTGKSAGLPIKPSEYVLRQCVISADPDEPGLDTVIDFIGDDNLVWNTDYPHPDAPDPNQILPWFSAHPISQDSKRKILWDNAVRLYGSRLLESAP
jgi:Amidohydrolase